MIGISQNANEKVELFHVFFHIIWDVNAKDEHFPSILGFSVKKIGIGEPKFSNSKDLSRVWRYTLAEYGGIP